MTVRATSNFTNKLVSDFVQSQGLEIGGGDDEGGRGFAVTSYTTYREVDNNPAATGMVFTPGSKHLPEGTPQANRI